MPSKFLQKRMPEAVVLAAGNETVELISFDASGVDATTGDVDEAAAYAASPVPLPALIDLAPSEAKRAQFGQEIQFDATLIVTAEHLRAAQKTLVIGDAFILPDDPRKYYVVKIVPGWQAGRVFTAYEVAISRRIGRP